MGTGAGLPGLQDCPDGRSVSEYGGQWTVIDNDKCEDSVPQCGIIAHSGFVDHKQSENKKQVGRNGAEEN